VKAVGRIGPVIGLGRPGEQIGVGRILTSEAEWREAVVPLIDHAIRIFCIPSGRPGALWKLDYIVSRGHLDKTIFIMPPFPAKGPLNRRKFELRDDWGKLVTEMDKRDLNLPQYNKAGLLFCLASRPLRTREFRLNSPRAIRRSVEDLLGAQ
jgi:hypothetical protein